MQAVHSPIPHFDLPIVIKPSDIDEQGHVNNVVYLSWVQDVAVAHWNSLTSAEHRSKYAWVALRHEIDYKAEAVLGDSIVARTWTGVAQGMRYPRHTEIIRLGDGKVLCNAVRCTARWSEARAARHDCRQRSQRFLENNELKRASSRTP